MTDKEKLDKLVAEIERRIKAMKDNFATNEASKSKHAYTLRMIDHQELLSFANSLLKEPISENLEEEIERFNSQPESNHYKQTARHFAKWQKEQMMAKAVEREVKIDAGGYPYIDATELYDYVSEEPLAKAGDKVKVLIIKEADYERN